MSVQRPTGRPPAPPARVIGCFFLLAAVAAAWGCRFDHHRADLGVLAAGGLYHQAAEHLDNPKTRKLYGDKNEVLWKLERGAVALYLGDTEEAIRLLNDAEETIDRAREASLGDVAGRWVLNDRAAKYIASPYEDIYINVLKMLAQLEAGRVSGGATVEARRLIVKVDLLRDEYLRQREAAGQEMEGKGDRFDAGAGLVNVNEEGRFIESPLGTFLSAVAFMKAGEPSFQDVAGRRLAESIQLQQGLIGPVRPEPFEGLAERRPDSVSVLTVALSGRGPVKVAERFGPLLIGTVPIYFELPTLRTFPSEVGSVAVEVEGGGVYEMPLVEDLAAVATENHRRTLPLIRTRTVLRTIAKMGASIALTEAARRGASDRDQGIVQLGAALAGLIAIAATERADIRCWMFLPGQAHVALLDLPPGRHRIRNVYKGFGGGVVYTSPWREIDVDSRGLTTVVSRYWR